MNATQEQGSNSPKTALSTAGALIYAAAAILLSALCSLFLQNNGEDALFTLLFPVFMFLAGAFASAVAVHSKNAIFFSSAVISVAISFALTLDILRSLVCLGAFAAALFISRACKSKNISQSGAVCALVAIYSAFILYGVAVLCIQKYSSLTLEAMSRAYDSFCNIILKNPREILSIIETEYGADPAYTSLISDYKSTVEMLAQALPELIYFIPSAFLYICALGSFITARVAIRHTKMQGRGNPLGAFSVSVVTAAVYLLICVASIFADYKSPLGITLNIVSTLPSMALALIGLSYIYFRMKLHPRRRLLSALLILLLLFMTSTVQSVMALVGAYKVTQLYLIQKAKDSLNGNK